MSDRSKCQWIALSRRGSYTDAQLTAAVPVVLSALKTKTFLFSLFPLYTPKRNPRMQFGPTIIKARPRHHETFATACKTFILIEVSQAQATKQCRNLVLIEAALFGRRFARHVQVSLMT